MEGRSSFFSKLGTYLGYGEIAALAIALVGIILNRYDSSQGFQWIMVGLSGLAAIQFLQAYTPAEGLSEDPSAPKKSILDLLPVILRKLLYVSVSIAIVGLLFSILMLAGAREILHIGGVGLLAGCLLSGVIILRNNGALILLRSPLVRAVPLLIIIAYLKFGH